MASSDKKTILFWSLVIGIFLIVFLFWLPGFIQSIGTIAQSVGTQTQESSSTIEDTVTPQIEEFKKTFDTLLKQIPTENEDPAKLNTPVVVQPSPEAELSQQQFCKQQGGIHQSRQSERHGSYDVCIFPDGSECEQKQFQSGACTQSQTMVAEDVMKEDNQ